MRFKPPGDRVLIVAADDARRKFFSSGAAFPTAYLSSAISNMGRSFTSSPKQIRRSQPSSVISFFAAVALDTPCGRISSQGASV